MYGVTVSSPTPSQVEEIPPGLSAWTAPIHPDGTHPAQAPVESMKIPEIKNNY
jgi:hypothetical protein